MDALIVSVALSESEIDDVDIIPGGVSASNQEIVRFNIPMNQSFFVYLLNSLHELSCDEQNCFEVK